LGRGALNPQKEKSDVADQVAVLQLPPDNHIAFRVDAVNLKN